MHGWYLWCSACVSDGAQEQSCFLHAASIFAARRSADVWMNWLGVPQSHRAPPRTSGGGVDMSVCVCVCESVRVLKELCSECFFVCFSVGRGLSQIVVRCWCSVTTSTTAVSGQVECWSCFSLRHRNGLRYQMSTPSELVFSVGRLQVCRVAFSIACAVAGARFGGSEEGTPIILYVIFLIILLVLQIWKCFQFCERFFFQLHALEHLGQLNTLPSDP